MASALIDFKDNDDVKRMKAVRAASTGSVWGTGVRGEGRVLKRRRMRRRQDASAQTMRRAKPVGADASKQIRPSSASIGS